jgi:hypothetical protein
MHRIFKAAGAILATALVASAGNAVAVTPLSGKELFESIGRNLKTCRPTAASIFLIDETVLTRTRITRERVASFTRPVVLGQGDPRLQKLSEALRGIKVASSDVPDPDIRMLLLLTCADGAALEVIGTRTDSGRNGRIYLMANGIAFSTRTPLRRRLDRLVRSP